MAETSPVVAALLVAVAAVGAVPVAALTGGVPAQQPATNDSAANESLAPGERFAGVVGVQQAEVAGEIEARAFGQRVAAAASNRSAAGVVAGEVENQERRLSELDAEIAALERAHENGTVSEGQYRARLAKLHAHERAIERQLNRTASVADRLPAAALEARGVNVTAIRTLRSQASQLTGPEVAAIARTITGEGAGKGIGGPPADAGPPAFVENRTRGPGGTERDRGNGNGPPEDAGPGNETAASGTQGNGNGPPEGAGSNETGPPKNAGTGDGTGPSEASGPGNETGPPDNAGDGAGNGGAGAADGDGGDGDSGGADGGRDRSLSAALRR
ncbi:hypothetical protein C475_02468 [Halosimplex carlsbadense 2-9-1]|uniref:Uncharacterized protein n=1 Tax=Halosimplex carlsbadense 2-9-1 TaxID=797114 RepID=M0D1U4_9EURY|nr:hypothetical protein [Halosimplex carlsbadense]ELZ29476.1 hypothetical protein C475_02468 [Halosimplex carlsbadense 2-9-1]